MIIKDCIQGDERWLAERAGKVSASSFGKILTPTGARTNGETRKSYLYQVAGERISKTPEESFKNDWMLRGNELEPDARVSFEQTTGLFVAQTGMVLLDEREEISCSPDGLVGVDSGLELKCPKISTHIGYIESNKLPGVYKPQVMGCMWICQRETWHFMSYHPSIKSFMILVERDEKYISTLIEAVEEFNSEVNSLIERIS